MPELTELAIAQLELDPRNPRLGKVYNSELETAHALAKQQGTKLVVLAAHIVEHGLDPTTLSAVVPLPGRQKRYLVVEGNRRLLALRALDSPAVVTPALEPREGKAIQKLSARYQDNPIERISCIVFASEDEARPWVELRHANGNPGSLVPWSPEEKRRYEARFGPGSVELQVLDFVKAVGGIDPDAEGAFITNINRALLSAKLMANYGLVKAKDGTVQSWFPLAEIRKPLTKLVHDMHSGAENSRSLNSPTDRENYFKKFKAKELPNPKTKLPQPVSLGDLASSYTPTGGAPKPKPKAKPAPRQRTTLIPKSTSLSPTATRLADIVRELKSLNVNDFPNAASVTLRVLFELSMDTALDDRNLKAQCNQNDALAKKIKTVASDLYKQQQISQQLKKAIDGVANNQTSALAAGVQTWHQYVHNSYTHPKPTELRVTWDELEPFLLALWP